MKNSVSNFRAPKTCLLALLLISLAGCGSLGKNKTEHSTDIQNKSGLIIERVDAKTGEVISSEQRSTVDATTTTQDQTNDAQVITQTIENNPSSIDITNDSSISNSTVHDSTINSSSNNPATTEQLTNDLPEGVVSWESISTAQGETVVEDNPYTVEAVEGGGIPTLPNDAAAINTDAPIFVDEQNVNSADPYITQDTTQYTNQNLDYATSYDLWSRIRAGYAIPQVEHHLIDRYVTWNQTHADYVYEMLTRSRPYLYYIVEQIEARGMPMEIALLPAIESAYKARVYSRSRASGLWQFIPSTGRFFGMRQDWWSDQRRDVIIATNTALDYLIDLNQEFNGDWLLALASYNGGRGTIGKAIRSNQRQGLNTDYFSLRLSQETSHYVPKLLGLSKVIMNPSVYGVSLPNIPNEPFFETVELKGQTDLFKLVNNTSINKKDFDRLNPQFLRWASDPKGPHRIIVPLADSLSVSNYVNSLSSEKIHWRKHQLVSGDTLSGLARQYGVNSSAIQSINGMRTNRLRAGKTILIPVRNNSPVRVVSTYESAPTATTYSQNVATVPQVQQEPTEAIIIESAPVVSQTVVNNVTDSRPDLPSMHRVQSGDTLWNISRNYNISIDELLALNNLQYGSTLSLNQTIRLKRSKKQ